MNVDWSNVLITVLSVLVGGLITAYFSRRYYVKASEDLKQETDHLKRYNIMLLRLLDQAGLIPVKWDEQGNPLMEVTKSVTTYWRVEAKEDAGTDEEDDHV
ncbi:MAG: hypothetical protein M3Q60_09755 [Actinomycetota bacterium]|nr:hypothetical protein [Actinomycetota bacterium]